MKSSWRSALHHIYALRGWPSTLPHTRFSVSAGWTEIRGWITHNLHTTKYREIQNRVLYVPVLYHYTSQNLHNYFKSLPHPYKVGTITFALQFWETEAESGLFFFATEPGSESHPLTSHHPDGWSNQHASLSPTVASHPFLMRDHK